MNMHKQCNAVSASTEQLSSDASCLAMQAWTIMKHLLSKLTCAALQAARHCRGTADIRCVFMQLMIG